MSNLTDWRSRYGAAADGGFTLIEAVAAIAVSALVLTAIAFAAIAGIQASGEARINQQAGDVIESTIESARAQSYDNLVMSSSDPTLSTDRRLIRTGCPGTSPCIAVPNDSGSGTVKESIDESSAGGYVSTHIQTDTTGTNKVPFTVSSYITEPTDEADGSYKRFLVYVDWSIYGRTHEREASTFITSTTRGLPLPHFTLTPTTPTALTVNPGATVTFGFTIKNLGARDAFDVISSTESLGWTYYQDDGDGTLDATDTLLTDTPGTGAETSLIDPNSSVEIWVTRTVPSTATSGTSTVSFTATSVSQPSLGSGTSSHSQSTTVTVNTGIITPTPSASPSSTPSSTPSSSPSPTSTSPTCTVVGTPGTVGTQYYLRETNTSLPFAGTSGAASFDPMAFSAAAPTASTLQNYSTDVSGGGTGRNLAPTSGTPAFSSSPTVSQTAEWQYQVTATNGTTLNGTTYLAFWAEPADGQASENLNFQAMAGWGSQTGKSGKYKWSQEGSTTASGTGTNCGSWREFVIPIAMPTGNSLWKASNNDYLELLLFNTGTTNVQIAYDTTSYPSNVLWSQQ